MMKSYFFVSVVILTHSVLSQECGKDYGDEEPKEGFANLKQYPSMANIYHKDRKGDLKSAVKGMLIAPRYVLTTAVIVSNKAVQPVKIRFGDQNLKTALDCSFENPEECAPAPVEAEIEAMFAHPQFDSNKFVNDIAIIKLKEAVPYSEYVQPICLPKKDEIIEDGENLYFCTYSPLTSAEKARTTIIMPQRNIDQCAEAYESKKHTLTNIDTKICAGSEGRDGCKGDSGAALMRKNKTSGQWTAVGLMSFGANPCGMKDFPSVYTKISKYIDWIDSVMQN